LGEHGPYHFVGVVPGSYTGNRLRSIQHIRIRKQPGMPIVVPTLRIMSLKLGSTLVELFDNFSGIHTDKLLGFFIQIPAVTIFLG
jgi:hypothetical protein